MIFTQKLVQIILGVGSAAIVGCASTATVPTVDDVELEETIEVVEPKSITNSAYEGVDNSLDLYEAVDGELDQLEQDAGARNDLLEEALGN